MARSDTKALSGRDPANRPSTHGVMTPEFFNEASTYKLSMDRQGMRLGLQSGHQFGNPCAESNDRPGDVADAINGPSGEKPSGVGMKGYGR